MAWCLIHSSAILNIDLTRNELKETHPSHWELAGPSGTRTPSGRRYAMILHLGGKQAIPVEHRRNKREAALLP